MKKSKRLSLFLMLCLLLTLSSLSALAKTPSPRLSKKSLTLYVDETYTLSVLNTNKKVKWSSSRKKIASVSNGVITGKKKGTCKIYAKIGKKKLACKVTVKKSSTTPKQVLTVNVSSLSMRVGDTRKLTVTYIGKGGLNIGAGLVRAYWLSTKGNKSVVKLKAHTIGSEVIEIFDDYGQKVKIPVTVVGKNSPLPAPAPAPTPEEELLNNLKTNFTAQLIVPSIGSSFNSHCQVKYTNNTGTSVGLPATIYANGKACTNYTVLQNGFNLENGNYTVGTYYRDLMPTNMYNTKDMYLDNHSFAWNYIEINGKKVVIKFDTNGTTQFAYTPQELGIY